MDGMGMGTKNLPSKQAAGVFDTPWHLKDS